MQAPVRFNVSAIVCASAVALFLAAVVLAPLTSYAQEDELSIVIRAALLEDPNTSTLSEAELDALVVALAQESLEEGVSARDIFWQPVEPALLN